MIAMKPLTILATGTIGWGHMNACAGALEQVRKRGHRVVFVTREGFRDHLSSLGYEVYVYESEKPDESKGNASQQFATDLITQKVVGPSEPYENLVATFAYLDGPERVRDLREQDLGMRQAIQLFKPDLIYYDANILLPSIYYSGIPWVKNYCTTPQFYVEEDTIPPGGSGTFQICLFVNLKLISN